MRTKGLSYCIFVICSVVLFSFLLGGCASLHEAKKSSAKLIRRLIPFKSSKTTHAYLKKKLGLTRFENKTQYTELNFDTSFQNALLKTLETSCPTTHLVLLGDPGFPTFLINLPLNSAGKIDSFVLAQKAKPHGFNAILNASLLGIRNKPEKKGFRWFRGLLPWFNDSRMMLEVQVAAEMFDTESGAKLMDEVFLHEIEVNQTDLEDSQNTKIRNLDVLNEMLDEIADAMSEKICDTIRPLPWVGFVLRADANQIIISGGEKAGLKPGQLFEVFNTSRVMQGADGQRFYLRGEKTGEIRIKIVHENKAEAVIVSSQLIMPGNSIIPK